MIGFITVGVLVGGICFLAWVSEQPYNDGVEELNCLMDEYMDYLDDLGPRRGYEYLSFDAWYREREAPKLPPAQVVPRVYR